ncbi:hypothetical protein Aaci_2547 [Alicyclobacillus acidocaldarius subsp. acidocaldarius DSM 446]|uniref:Uncharacterized protein n=1 Tax=Alicyclobacillus acidocaldarius subsp. acidocaldarius (strain ATCC 27009 / DSM 446 / BCRC 14685 / JCM 5260 / KCTC 1825 / NBRC 15652 / NCIMB 11725 / NRRL B-14509 / 104-IA) TaxID=521098 RepID=C8WT37_ALIAD|nr:hypothetical protein Aaci_2547 [Alicyclobacillus acidocaldarius subsp. acidocaldarius DSM 446]
MAALAISERMRNTNKCSDREIQTDVWVRCGMGNEPWVGEIEPEGHTAPGGIGICAGTYISETTEGIEKAHSRCPPARDTWADRIPIFSGPRKAREICAPGRIRMHTAPESPPIDTSPPGSCATSEPSSATSPEKVHNSRSPSRRGFSGSSATCAPSKRNFSRSSEMCRGGRGDPPLPRPSNPAHRPWGDRNLRRSTYFRDHGRHREGAFEMSPGQRYVPQGEMCLLGATESERDMCPGTDPNAHRPRIARDRHPSTHCPGELCNLRAFECNLPGEGAQLKKPVATRILGLQCTLCTLEAKFLSFLRNVQRGGRGDPVLPRPSNPAHRPGVVYPSCPPSVPLCTLWRKRYTAQEARHDAGSRAPVQPVHPRSEISPLHSNTCRGGIRSFLVHRIQHTVPGGSESPAEHIFPRPRKASRRRIRDVPRPEIRAPRGDVSSRGHGSLRDMCRRADRRGTPPRIATNRHIAAPGELCNLRAFECNLPGEGAQLKKPGTTRVLGLQCNLCTLEAKFLLSIPTHAEGEGGSGPSSSIKSNTPSLGDQNLRRSTYFRDHGRHREGAFEMSPGQRYVPQGEMCLLGATESERDMCPGTDPNAHRPRIATNRHIASRELCNLRAFECNLPGEGAQLKKPGTTRVLGLQCNLCTLEAKFLSFLRNVQRGDPVLRRPSNPAHRLWGTDTNRHATPFARRPGECAARRSFRVDISRGNIYPGRYSAHEYLPQRTAPRRGFRARGRYVDICGLVLVRFSITRGGGGGLFKGMRTNVPSCTPLHTHSTFFPSVPRDSKNFSSSCRFGGLTRGRQSILQSRHRVLEGGGVVSRRGGRKHDERRTAGTRTPFNSFLFATAAPLQRVCFQFIAQRCLRQWISISFHSSIQSIEIPRRCTFQP